MSLPYVVERFRYKWSGRGRPQQGHSSNRILIESPAKEATGFGTPRAIGKLVPRHWRHRHSKLFMPFLPSLSREHSGGSILTHSSEFYGEYIPLGYGYIRGRPVHHQFGQRCSGLSCQTTFRATRSSSAGRGTARLMATFLQEGGQTSSTFADIFQLENLDRSSTAGPRWRSVQSALVEQCQRQHDAVQIASGASSKKLFRLFH